MQRTRRPAARRRAFVASLYAALRPGEHELRRLRSLGLALLGLLIAFEGAISAAGAVDASGGAALWLVAAAGVAVLGVSFLVAGVRRRLALVVQLLAVVVAAWFVLQAALGDFSAERAIALLFVLPAAGLCFTLTVEALAPAAAFFAGSAVAAAAGSWTSAAPGIDPLLFSIALGVVSALTLYAAAAHLLLQAQRRSVEEKTREIARFRSALLENVQHELRTPLTSIIGWTAVLDEELADGHREAVRHIAASGERLHRILDAVLELAQLDVSGRVAHPESLDLSRCVADVLRPWQREAAEKGLVFELETPARLRAYTDRACVERILACLVDNAVKFTAEGRVTVTLAPRGSDVVLCVEDTGIGIAPDFLPHLFSAFRQEDEGLTRAYAGVGLGLALARRLVELVGGTIRVDSEPGRGARFTVVLPGALAVRAEARPRLARVA